MTYQKDHALPWSFEVGSTLQNMPLKKSGGTHLEGLNETRHNLKGICPRFSFTSVPI